MSPSTSPEAWLAPAELQANLATQSLFSKPLPSHPHSPLWTQTPSQAPPGGPGLDVGG